MQIHVVQQGETLTSISRAYSLSVDELINANQIPNQNKLVVGQTIVIPIVGSFYWVQPGDSLFSIGNRFGVPFEQLAKINRISVNEQLQIGLRLYIPPKQKHSLDVNGYVEPRGTTVAPILEQSARENAPYLTYLAPFSFQVNRDGTLKEPLMNNFPAIARANNNLLMMVITNQEDDQFNADLAHILLTDMTVQNNFLNNIVAAAKKHGFKDIHFDFEFLLSADREHYNNFLRKAKARFNEEGWLMSTALAPKTSATQTGQWYEAHDYRAHGEIADFVVIMTYEWGYSGGPAMAVSPIGPVRQVLQYAISEIPPEKILMGQNLYGYDWTLPFVEGTTARALSPQQAISLAAEKNVAIQYDQTAQAPFFHYVDNGIQHEVWFEDARSIQAKFNLIKELNLRGISYWKLGLSFPQNWLLLTDNFTINKR